MGTHAVLLGLLKERKEEGMAMPVMVTPTDLAAQMGKDVHTVYEWASRATDPLPLRYEAGTRKNGSVVVSEFEEWWGRNSVHYQDRS